MPAPLILGCIPAPPPALPPHTQMFLQLSSRGSGYGGFLASVRAVSVFDMAPTCGGAGVQLATYNTLALINDTYYPNDMDWYVVVVYGARLN